MDWNTVLQCWGSLESVQGDYLAFVGQLVHVSVELEMLIEETKKPSPDALRGPLQALKKERLLVRDHTKDFMEECPMYARQAKTMLKSLDQQWRKFEERAKTAFRIAPTRRNIAEAEHHDLRWLDLQRAMETAVRARNKRLAKSVLDSMVDHVVETFQREPYVL